MAIAHAAPTPKASEEYREVKSRWPIIDALWLNNRRHPVLVLCIGEF